MRRLDLKEVVTGPLQVGVALRGSGVVQGFDALDTERFDDGFHALKRSFSYEQRERSLSRQILRGTVLTATTPERIVKQLDREKVGYGIPCGLIPSCRDFGRAVGRSPEGWPKEPLFSSVCQPQITKLFQCGT